MRTRAPHLEKTLSHCQSLGCLKLHFEYIISIATSGAPGEVAGPREAEEGDGGEVVNKHLPKVFPLHIEKLKDRQRPVESQLKINSYRKAIQIHKVMTIFWCVCQPETYSTTIREAPQDGVDTLA